MISDPHWIPSQFRLPTQKPSQLIPALNTSNLRPAHKNQVNFYSYIKTRLLPARTQKRNQFWPHHWNQVRFDPHTKTKSISIPHPKTKFVHIPLLKSSQFQSPGRFRCPDTKIELISIQTLKTRHFRPPDENEVSFYPYTKIKSIPILHTPIKYTWTTHTTVKAMSMSTLNCVIFGLCFFACYTYGYMFLWYGSSTYHIILVHTINTSANSY